ncbi:hypothetical protein PFISCL1PPCAC_28566, partial [Pristionchus fissidentatus]
SEEEAYGFEIDHNEGPRVVEVKKGSIASKAGLSSYSRIVGVNEVRFHSQTSVESVLEKMSMRPLSTTLYISRDLHLIPRFTFEWFREHIRFFVILMLILDKNTSIIDTIITSYTYTWIFGWLLNHCPRILFPKTLFDFFLIGYALIDWNFASVTFRIVSLFVNGVFCSELLRKDKKLRRQRKEAEMLIMKGKTVESTDDLI